MNQKNERGKRLAKNTFASLFYQITTLLCGFITPWLFLQYYGSEVNGLVTSITSFLALIAFLEMGVGAVVQSSLYKPLAENDKSLISKIMVSSTRFFRKIALILLGYVIVLIAVYPFISDKELGYLYTATLIAAMAISSFAQYYFGVSERLLLTADQKGHIQFNAQTITLIVNTVVTVILIKAGVSIQLVKLTTSLIYLVRPLVLRIYVDKYYKVDWKATYEQEPIEQKWNGVAQHVAAIILDNTDPAVLTLMSTLENVSIYGVYNLVVFGLKSLLISATSGIQALMGELYAKGESKELKEFFSWVEWAIHSVTTLVFGCCAALLVPFVLVYTKGINDANYCVPLFALLLVVANAGHCLRLPYNYMILAAGHYKQTQHNYIIAAVMNVVISLVTVKLWGIIGVAIGTLVAMLYQTVWMANYDSKHFIDGALKSFLKQFATDVAIFVVGILYTMQFGIEELSYVTWGMIAVKVVIIWLGISVIVNAVVYRDKCIRLLKILATKLNKTKA